MGTNPLRQVETQLLPYRLRVLQEVQLSAATEQVLQSPVQATAIPDIFTYPEGVVERQEVLWKKTKPVSQLRQLEYEAQLTQFMPAVAQRTQVPVTDTL